jgi:hypothetical protein
VLRAMNLLPPPVQRRAAAAVYQHRWFNLLSVGILADVNLVPDVDKLAVEVADAFREYQAAPFA